MNTSQVNSTRPYLLMRGITKQYRVNGVLANDNVDFRVATGEIHALVGENGAGKTTLMKILDGMERPDHGEIFLKGRPVVIHSPKDAIKLGIGMVYQHFRLIRNFSVAENVVLGAEPAPARFFYNKKAAYQRVIEISNRIGFTLNPAAPVIDLSSGEMQQIELLKVLYRSADLLILDEPTSALTEGQITNFFKILRKLKGEGKTVVLITHKLDEVMAISDRVTVMRRGKCIATRKTEKTDRDELADLMVGGENIPHAIREHIKSGPTIYEIRNLSLSLHKRDTPVLKNISLEIKSGEVLGITGVSGNGLLELEDLVSGMIHLRAHTTEGRILFKNEDITNTTSRELRKRHIALVPSNRLFRGVSLESTVIDNMILNTPPGVYAHGILQAEKALKYVKSLADSYAIKADPHGPLGILSGGNIQRTILAREIENLEAFLLLSEPTWGVDVAATAFIHNRILDLRKRDVGIMLISSDLDEIMTLSDRIAVMFNGEIVKLFINISGLSKKEVARYMLGSKDSEQSGRQQRKRAGPET